MDSILLTVRWGSIRHLVRVEKGANFDAFKKATLTCFPTIDADAVVNFHILIPGADPTKLTEAEICDSTDLAALRTGDLVVLKVSGPTKGAADTLPVIASSLGGTTTSPLKTPAPVTKTRPTTAPSTAVSTASPVVPTTPSDSRRPSTALPNAVLSTPSSNTVTTKTSTGSAPVNTPVSSSSVSSSSSSSSTVARDRGSSVASVSTQPNSTTVPKVATPSSLDNHGHATKTTGTPVTNSHSLPPTSTAAKIPLSREPSVASIKEILNNDTNVPSTEVLPGAVAVTPSKPLLSTPSVATMVSPLPPQVIQQSQLGSPRIVVVPNSNSFNPVTNLAKVGLIVDPDTSIVSVDTRPSSAWGTPIVTSTSSFFGSTPSKKTVTRKVILNDFLPDGPAAHPSVDTSLAGLIQTEVLTSAKKRNHAFVPIDIPRDAANGTAHVRIFASANWEIASTVLVIIPSEGMPPGMWDTHTGIVSGTQSVSITPYLKELEQFSWAASLGIVLANPYNNHTADKAPIPGNETPVAHILTLWDTVLTGKKPKEGEETSTVTGPTLAFLSHGAGADLVLALLTDANRGIDARARTRAVAMVSPKQPPRQVLAAAVASSGEGGTSRAAAGILRTQLRQKGMAWNGELRSSVRPVVPQADGSLPLEIQEISNDGTDTTTIPYYSDDYGCHVQPVALAIPGTAAYREEANALVNGYIPYAARKNVLSFLDHLLKPAEGENAKNMNSAATWVTVQKDTVTQAAAAKLAANPPVEPKVNSPVKESSASSAADAHATSPVKTENEPPKTPATATVTKPKGKSRARELMEAAASPAAQTDDAEKKATPATESVPSTPVAVAPATHTVSPVKTVTESSYIPPTPIPEPFAAAGERAYKRLQMLHLDAFAPGGGKEWKSNGTVSGVQTYIMSPDASKPADTSPDDAFVGARGDSIIPFPLAAIADLLINDMDARYELDGQLDKIEAIETLTGAAAVDRMKFKAVFPTDPRDFATMSAWQVNEDGVLHMFGTSVEHPKIPLVKGFVRGRLDIGGWVITPLSLNDYNTAARSLGLKLLDESTYRGACRVSYLFRTSIGGNLPKFVVQQVTAAQAKQPAMVTKILERKYGGKDGSAKLAKLPPWTNPVPAGTPSSTIPSSTTHDTVHAHTTESTGVPSVGLTESAPSTAASEPTVVSTEASTVSSPSTNLNGRWKVNKTKSQSLDTLLKEMGVPYVARVFAASLEVTTTIVQTTEDFEITESSSLGGAKTVIPLDWNFVDEQGMDGKTVSRKAILLTGVDEIPTDDVDTFVTEYKSKGAPSPPNGATTYPRYGPGSGVVVSVAILPDKLGITRDERHLVSPTVLRLVTVYFRDGTVKARVTRYLDRLDTVPHELLAPVVVPSSPVVTATESTETTAEHKETVPTVVSAVETPVVTVADATVHEPAPTPASVVSSSTTVTAHPPVTPKADTDKVTSEPLSVPPNSVTKEEDHVIVTPIKIKPTLAEERASAALAALTNPPKSDEPLVPEGWSFAKWIPDEQATTCRTCKTAFTSLNRVHHCRACGLAFCDTCSSARLPLAHLTAPQLKLAKVTADQYVRHCTTCALPVIQDATIVGSTGGKVILKGRNFGSADMITIGRTTAVYVEGGPGNASIRAKGVTAEPVEHTSLTFIMPPGIGSRTLRVEVENRVGTFPYTYASPVLESAEAIETDGGLCVLRGTNFPGYDAELSSLDIRLNGNPCRAERIAEPFKAIVIRVPAGAGGAEVNQLTLTAPGMHPLPAPLPYGYAPATLFAGRVVREPLPDGAVGAVLVLYGASFGTISSNVTVTVAGMVCKDIQLLVPHSKLRVVLPDHIVATARNGKLEEVTVTIAGQSSAPFSAQL